jgi:AraC-like DNA-binding protein/quercetin dioxygenase-like cupin family protein
MKAKYIKTQLKNLISISKIVTIPYFEFDESFVFDGESHDFWELVYIDRGRVRVKGGDRDIILGAGEVIMHKPNEFHAIRAYESEPSFFVISFVSPSPRMEYLEGYTARLDEVEKQFITSIIREAESTFIIPKNDTALCGLTKREEAIIGGEQLIKTYLEQLLIFMIRGLERGGELFPSRRGMDGIITAEVKRYLKESLDRPFRISELCADIGYSKSYLSKIFHEQSGHAIAAYATMAKVTRAKELIRGGTHNFSEISDLLAFDNPQYFSRVFKRATGMTPSEFRQSLRLN